MDITRLQRGDILVLQTGADEGQFERIASVIREALHFAGHDYVPIIVIGNGETISLLRGDEGSDDREIKHRVIRIRGKALDRESAEIDDPWEDQANMEPEPLPDDWDAPF